MRRDDPGASAVNDSEPAVVGGGHRSSSYVLGALWAGVNAASNVLLPFAVFVFFAREISPPMLGLVALAAACTEILKALGLPGIYEALLQQKGDLQRCYETALALLLLAGFGLVPAGIALLYGIGFAVPGLHQHFMLLALLTLRIPLDLASVQPQVVLVKRLDYRRLSLRSVVANVLAGGAGILTAGLVTPVCGLITYQVGQSLLSLIGTSVGRGLLARPRIHPDCLRHLRRETIFATGNRSLAATINYLDQTVMAPLAGDTGLAFYNLGKRLETTFVTVANSFSSILFQPLFAAEGALSRQKATRRALLVLTLVCGTPAAVVFCNDRLVVSLIFGRNWIAAAPIVGWLCLNGLVRAVGMVPGSFLSVCGRNRELLITSVVSAVLSLGLVVAIAPTSVALCAAAMAAKNAAIVAWMAWLTRRDIEQPFVTYAMAVVIPAGLMMAAAAAVSMAFPAPAGLLSVLLELGLSGVAVAACCAAWVALTGAPLLRLPARAPSGGAA